MSSPSCASPFASALARCLSWSLALANPSAATRVALLGVLVLLGAPRAARGEGLSGATLRARDNPLSDQANRYNYRSNVTRVTPGLPGLQVRVVQYVDRLVLTDHTGKTVTVYGYQGEPYARVLADGTAELNTSSRAYYLNEGFFGLVAVPPSASPTATPKWTVVDRSGTLEWHDHRIHWMLPSVPPQVTNRAKRTKVFDWTVPIEVGAQRGTVDGELVWVPEEDWAPLALFAALIALALAGVAVALVRRRRTRRAAQAAASGPAGEAW